MNGARSAEHDLALQEAVATITTFRDVTRGGEPLKLTIASDTKLFVHSIGVITVLALEEIDRLGGDADALLRDVGMRAAGGQS